VGIWKGKRLDKGRPSAGGGKKDGSWETRRLGRWEVMRIEGRRSAVSLEG